MPLLTNEFLLKTMALTVEHRGWGSVGEPWWLEDGALDAAWLPQWPSPLLGAGGLVCGDVVGWFGRLNADDAAPDWYLTAYSPRGVPEWDVGDFHDGRDLYKLEQIVNKYRARTEMRIPTNPIKVGDRVACSTRDGRSVAGLCTQSDNLNRCVQVQLRPGWPSMNAFEIGKHWYGLLNRNEAFDKVWPTRGEWTAYIAMATHLARVQRQLVADGLADPATLERTGTNRKTKEQRDKEKEGKPPKIKRPPNPITPPVILSVASAPVREGDYRLRNAPAPGEEWAYDEHQKAFAIVQEWTRTGQIANNSAAPLAAMWYLFDLWHPST